MGPLKWCPAGHLIMALSTGPSAELMVNRHLTSAGSPHRAASSWSRQAGQSRNIIVVSANRKVGVKVRLLHAAARKAGPA